jgi:mannose-P-dolichol utilization defect 1
VVVWTKQPCNSKATNLSQPKFGVSTHKSSDPRSQSPEKGFQFAYPFCISYPFVQSSPGLNRMGYEVLLSKCYNIMVTEGDLLNMSCLSELSATLLSMVIMAGSVVVQLPQIITIIRSESVEGLSPVAFYSALAIPTTFIIYNIKQGNAFETYGENFFSFIQYGIIVLLIWAYNTPTAEKNRISMREKIGVILGLVFLCGFCYLLPMEYQFILPLMSLPLLFMSRVPQIMECYKSKSTGTLSFISLFLIFGGSAARVFTTVVKVGFDFGLISNYLFGALFSFILLVQIMMYLPSSKKKTE